MSLKSHALELWAPPPKLKSWEWCEQNLMLPPQASPRPGRYSLAPTPYAKAIFEAFDDPRTEDIVLAWGAQTGKTMTMLALMAYVIGNSPLNTIFMMPSADLAQSFVETRFDPIMQATPALKKKLPADRHKNKILSKQLEGMALDFVGGNSPANLASRSAAFTFGDEIDKLDRSLGKEACPVELLKVRRKWYKGRKKGIWSSTVTTADWKIWPALLAGTYEKLFWPCPHCTKKFVPVWSMMKWKNDDGMTIEQKASTAHIECPECRGKFLDKHKRKALAEAEWKATNLEAHPQRVRSFHVCEIQSLLSSFSDMVIYFLNSIEKARQGDLGQLQNFINSSLCQPWTEGGYGKRDKEALKMLKDSRQRGVVPRDACALVAGADTQDDGFWYMVRAWCPGGRSALVQEGFVKSLDELGSLLWDKPWMTADQKPFRVHQTIIDSGGHRMDEVNNWCEKRAMFGVLPGLGRTKLSNPYTIKSIDQEKIGSQMRIVIDTTYFKDMIASKLKIQSGDPAEFRFHAETSEDYFDQMTVEYRDPIKQVWQCNKHNANHLWDCETYAMCAAYMIDAINIQERQDEPVQPRPDTPQSDRKDHDPSGDRWW